MRGGRGAAAPVASVGSGTPLNGRAKCPTATAALAASRKLRPLRAMRCVGGGILARTHKVLAPQPLSTRSDNELMLQIQAGDLGAFEQLVARYQTMVHGLAMSILRRPEDAEEATQDAFLKLFRARGSFDPVRALEPWLLRIAGNACRDKLRRRRAAQVPGARQGGDAGELLLEIPDARSLRDAARQLEDHSVRGELEQLSERVRQPLELKYLRGFTNQQIADALGISLSNVKVQLARGKDILASRLQGVRE